MKTKKSMPRKFGIFVVGICLMMSAPISHAQGWNIEVTFSKDGTVSPSNSVPVSHGSDISFEIQSSDSDFHHIAEVFVNGVPLGLDDTSLIYTNIMMSNITDHGSFHVEFARNEVVEIPLLSSSSANGHTASLIVDVAETRKLALTGSVPVDNSALWALAMSNDWEHPPLGGGMPVGAATNHVVLAYPALSVPTAPLDLNVAVTPDGFVDLYWRDSGTTSVTGYILQMAEIGTDNWISYPIDASHPSLSDLNLLSSMFYKFRVAAVGNGYVSAWSPELFLRTRVTATDYPEAALSPDSYAKTIAATFNANLNAATISEVVVQGALSGTHTSTVEWINGELQLDSTTHELFAGEEAWVIAPEAVLDSGGAPILPHAWQVRGDVRFGGGTFSSFTLVGETNFILAACTGDFDGNGMPDIALNTRDYSNVYRTYVYWNDGVELHTTNRWTRQYSGGEIPGKLICADFDGDGRQELLIERKTSNDVAICSLDTNHAMVVVGTFPVVPDAIECADMDADGDIDLLVAEGNFIQLMRNNGVGRFSVAPYESYAVTGVVDLAAVDVNLDGNVDIVAGTIGSAPETVLVNSGAGLSVQTIGSADIDTRRVFPVHYNDDNYPDLFFLQDKKSVIWTNTGAGLFSAAVTNIGDDIDMENLLGDLGDLNGDNRLDVFAAKQYSGSTFLLDGLDSKENSPVSLNKSTTVLLADWNNDNSLDILIGSGVDGSPPITRGAKVFYNQPPPLHVDPYITSNAAAVFRAEWEPSANGEAEGYEWILDDPNDDPEADPVDWGDVAPEEYPLVTNSSYTQKAAGRKLVFWVRPYNGNGFGDWRRLEFFKEHVLTVGVTGQGYYVTTTDAVGTIIMAVAEPGNLLATIDIDPLQSSNFVEVVESLPVSTTPVWVAKESGAVNLILNFKAYDEAVPEAWFTGLPDMDPGGTAKRYQDADGDGALNWEEYYAGTSATNALDIFAIIGWEPTSNRVVWSSVDGKSYEVEGSTDLMSGAFSNLTPAAVTADGTNTEHVLPGSGASTGFIRIRLKLD